MKRQKDTSARNTNKLSFGPNTFVGMAEVKLQPNSSLYALLDRCMVIPILPIKKMTGGNALVLDIDHTLCVGITKVALMRGPAVDLVFVQRIFDLIGEDTS